MELSGRTCPFYGQTVVTRYVLMSS